jgi:thiamine-phosphate pyrophosphorylase
MGRAILPEPLRERKQTGPSVWMRRPERRDCIQLFCHLQFQVPELPMLLYYITDRRQFPGSATEQRAALLRKIAEAARCGVDYIQLREKDLTARELLELAKEAAAAIRSAAPKQPKTGIRKLETGNQKLETLLLINSRLDVAVACGADGVHLRSDDISAADARAAWMKAAAARDSGLGTRDCVIAASCHTAGEVRRAQSEGADFVVFAPVFEKGGERGVGLEALRAVCRGLPEASTPRASPAVNIPVLALGGVTLENARACLEAGAAGIAGIRLFQDNDVAEVERRLRNIATAKDAK